VVQWILPSVWLGTPPRATAATTFSARERLFGFINGQTGAGNPQAQGFMHLAKDGMVGEDASLGDTAFINALRYGGDLLNVFGDFPTLSDPRYGSAQRGGVAGGTAPKTRGPAIAGPRAQSGNRNRPPAQLPRAGRAE